MKNKENIVGFLSQLYPHADNIMLVQRIEESAEKYSLCGSGKRYEYSEKDAFLICYADSVLEDGEGTLRILDSFISRLAGDIFSHVHILPFFPYSSDDGFSVKNYYQIEKRFGTWADVFSFSERRHLMIDLVINHVSSVGCWADGYFKQDARFKGFFIERDATFDCSNVIRPRMTPLFTEFGLSNGEKKELWTTFSEDQIDLNLKNPEVLLQLVDVIFYYVSNGADVLRLDAVSYIWKESGTSCCCLPQCHLLVKLIRAILDETAPYVSVITETNVPHAENIRFFGNGYDEAQLIYQFALPPLVAYSFLSENVGKLSSWLNSLTYMEGTCYYNFLSSHDGIGLFPVNDILSQEERNILIDACLRNGGQVSWKSLQGGKNVVYELNTTFYSLLHDPCLSDVENMRKVLTAIALLCALRGVPAVYYDMMFCGENYQEGFTSTGRKRMLNRRRYSINDAEDMASSWFFSAVSALLAVRKVHSAFSPTARQRVDSIDSAIISIERSCENECVLVLINFSCRERTVSIPSGSILMSGNALVDESSVRVGKYGYAYLEVIR